MHVRTYTEETDVTCVMYSYIRTSSDQMVQVVSILEAANKLGSVSFQSNDVSGAQNSELLF